MAAGSQRITGSPSQNHAGKGRMYTWRLPVSTLVPPKCSPGSARREEGELTWVLGGLPSRALRLRPTGCPHGGNTQLSSHGFKKGRRCLFKEKRSQGAQVPKIHLDYVPLYLLRHGAGAQALLGTRMTHAWGSPQVPGHSPLAEGGIGKVSFQNSC